MTVPMLVSGAATCLTQALADRSDTDYPSVLPIILVSVVLALLALIPYFFRSHDSKVLALPLAVFFAFYCFAAVSMLNMRLDRARRRIPSAQQLPRRILATRGMARAMSVSLRLKTDRRIRCGCRRQIIRRSDRGMSWC